jgi:hypothetical protein
VRSRTQKEVDDLAQTDQIEFKAAVNGSDEVKLDLMRCRKTVGLEMARGCLRISDSRRWEAVSILTRVSTKMPSTTNTLECFNGRCNAMTPHFNTFCGSLHRIVDMVMGTTDRFSGCLRENYPYECREEVKRCCSVGAMKIQKEVAFSQTTPGRCTCWETNHLSAIDGVEMPDSHQMALARQRQSVVAHAHPIHSSR